MSEGWVKLHRKIWKWPFANQPDYLSVWLYLLTNATHTSIDKIFKGERITLNPGQLITGRKAISSETNVHESKVQRILKKLEIEQQIEQQKSNQNRLITITCWHQYQGSEQHYEQPVNNQRTTDEQPVNTNKNVKKFNNERIKEKTPTKKIPPADLSAPPGIDPGAWNEFLLVRKKKRCTSSQYAITRLRNKIKNLQAKGFDANHIVERSAINGWSDLYEPQNAQQPAKQSFDQEIVIPEF